MPRYPKGMEVHTLPGAYHSGRATKSQLDFASNKLLMGAGVGADPTEIIIGSLGATCYVVANDAKAEIKTFAQILQAMGYPVWVCDGINDEAEINAAINASAGLVIASGGRFNIATPVLPINGTTLEGQGFGTEFFLVDNANCHVIYVYGLVAKSNITIRNLRINGNKTNQPTKPPAVDNLNGIMLERTVTNSVIENCWVHDCRDLGIVPWGIGAAICQGIIIRGNICYNQGRDGIGVDNACIDITIVNNICNGNGDWGIGVGISCSEITIVGNICNENENGLYLAVGCIRHSLIGNICENNTAAGIWLENACNDNVISGNVFRYNGARGVDLRTNCERNIISNNIISENRNYAGIGLTTGCNENVIVGNTIYLNQYYGIRVYASLRNIIQGNKILDNGQKTTNTYDGILLDGTSTHNTIIGNTIRSTAAPLHRYCIGEDAAADNNNVIKNNRMAGPGTAHLYISGAQTIGDLSIRSISLDLSGGATDIDVFHAIAPCFLFGYQVVYTEGSSADAGVDIRVGRYQDGVALDDDYFDISTSEVSKNKGYSKHFTTADLTQKVIAAGDTVTVGTAGGKVGIGEVMLILQIAEMAD